MKRNTTNDYRNLMWKHTLAMLGCLLCFLSGQTSLAQKVYRVNTEIVDTDLSGYISTAKNVKLNQRKQFKIVAEPLTNFGLSDDENWVKFELINEQKQTKRLVLFLDQTFLEKADFYQVEHDSIINKIELSEAIASKNRPFRSANFVFPFELKPNAQNSIFLRIKADKIQGISRALLRLSDETTFHAYTRRNSLTFGILVGFLLLSFVAGILLFYFGRKPIYAIYGIYILEVLLYYLGNSGYFNALLVDTFFGSARFTQGVLWIGSALHIYFIDEFLQLKSRFSRQFQNFITGLITISLILSFFYVCLPIPAFLPYFTRFLLFIISVLIIFLAVWGVRTKQSRTQLYSLAVFPSVLLIIYFLLSALKLLPLYWFAFALAFPFTVFEVIVFGVGLVYQFNEEKRQIERKLNEERAMVADRIISAQEHERQRISQDLHDDLGSTLSMLKFRLEETNKSVDNQLVDEINIANKAVEDLRQISYNLMPTMFLQRGLIMALNEFLSINKIASKVSFFHSGNEKRLDWETELSIFRIAKELLTNAIKHAKATKIELQLIYYEQFIYLSVEDNGIGVEEKQTESKGNGLKNINLRVNYLHGKLTIESSPKGTSVLIEIPYEPDPKNKDITH
jgi:signal transduction histidine kinase